MSKPKFIQPSRTFTMELKQRIDEYFETNNIAKTGNWQLFSKAIILMVAVVSIYVCLVVFRHGGWLGFAECMLLGFVAAGIGFNIMHDGGHGSFSQNKSLNKIASYTLDMLGASSFMWNMKHNVIHHTYTNIEGVDDDISAEPFIRMCESQPYFKMHKYQHYYIWALYSILYLFWVFVLDFKKYFTNKIGVIEISPMNLKDHLFFWACKVVYLFTFVLIPILSLHYGADMAWGASIGTWAIGYFTFVFTTGIVISIVFQLAHTVEHTHMVQAIPQDEGQAAIVEDEWTKHQIKTTANFATHNKIINWFTGGLNFQVEHHLFPRISHIHYPAISKIIKEVSANYDVTYNEYKYMYQAVISHIKYLKSMGAMPTNMA
jgi:linoleoyl-CoA desaturase